jgi:hypothetical protein
MQNSRNEEKTVTYVSHLDRFLTELIAKQEGVRPEEVTMEYIRRQRETRFYPKARYIVTSPKGGYSTAGLRVRSRDENIALNERIDAFLRDFI